MGRERVILDVGATFKPIILFELAVVCSIKPHCALQMSSAKIASRDHSLDNWAQSVIRSEAH